MTPGVFWLRRVTPSPSSLCSEEETLSASEGGVGFVRLAWKRRLPSATGSGDGRGLESRRPLPKIPEEEEEEEEHFIHPLLDFDDVITIDFD